MALTGFDPAVVKSSIGSVISAYNSLIQALGSDMQTKFVGGMSNKWACNEAKTFFNDALKPAVDSLITSTDNVFVSVVQAMNSAAQGWAASTQTEYSPVSFSPLNYRLDVSSIAENIGGVRGVDEAGATSVVSQLSVIEAAAISALSNAKSAVDNCGFMGGSQSTSLQNSLGIIQRKVTEATKEITSATTNAINTTVSNYGDIAGKVSSAFSTSE